MNIAVIGCGYIGSAAALLWKNQGHCVTATTRKPERIKELRECANKAFLIQGKDPKEFAELIAHNDTLLISIGADHPDEYETAYLQIAQMIRSLAFEMSRPKRLLYTSSTSVYGDAQGKWVDEDSPLLTDTEQGKILARTEQVYLSLKEVGWHVAILRLAQIYGPDREPSKQLKQLPATLGGNGTQYTNMVHRDDCASALNYLLEHKLEGIYNLADDDHPTREEFYHRLSEQFHLRKPSWDPKKISLHPGSKRVSNHKIKSVGFVFKFPHRQMK